jgi:hypothetical protein
MKKLLILLLIGLVPLLSRGDELKEGMIQLDRAFIPVLYYTYQGDLEKARAASEFLNQEWILFRETFQNRYETDDWREAFRMVEDWMEDAIGALEYEQQELAMVQFEKVWYELVQLRRRHKVSYYLDGLYQFRFSLATVVETAGDDQLCLLEWSEFMCLIDEAINDWKQFEVREVDKDLHQLTTKKLIQLEKARNRISQELEVFEDVIDCADLDQIADAARAVEPPVYDLLAVFGDFETAETYFAQR